MLIVLTLLALSLFVVTGALAAPPAQAGGEEYTVQAGDWLSKIAEKYYGDILAYPAIIQATNAKAAADSSYAVIDNPDLIEVGQKLWIPAAGEAVARVAPETEVTVIPLSGALSDRHAEISGMDWYGDNLIMLPQYPNFTTDYSGDGFVYALAKDDLLAFLDSGGSDPLDPTPVPFIDSGLSDRISGFEGFEAIAFGGDNDVYLTIEAEQDDGMAGYLVHGTIAPDLSALTLDAGALTEIKPQADVGNMSEETLIAAGDRLITIYEANGAGVNPSPVAHLFDLDLNPVGTVPLANIEYRLTDATELDGNNRFWAINYFYPGDEKLLPASDPIATAYGEGYTHSKNDGVERLIQFQYADSGVSMTGTTPIQLKLLADALRNWEGLVSLDGRGFLLMTDKYPQTILGFVPYTQ